MKVWVVEHGDFDDYSVDRLFTTEEAAQTFADRMNEYAPHQYTISAWEVEEDPPDVHWVFSLSYFSWTNMDRQAPSMADPKPLARVVSEPWPEAVEVIELAPPGGHLVQGSDRQAVINKFKELTAEK